MDQLIRFAADDLIWVFIGLSLAAVLLSQPQIRNNIIKLLLLAAPFVLILDQVLEKLILNPRPFIVENVTPLAMAVYNNGFPSGHTLFTLTIAFAIFAFRPRLGAVFIALGLVVGLARVLAKIHHPVDILGSVVVAAGCVVLALYILQRLKLVK